MNGEYVQTMGFDGEGFGFEVHYINSSHGVNDSKSFTDFITDGYLEYVAKRVEVFGYEKAVIYDKDMHEVATINNQKVLGVA